jgi:hypothetical protein
MTLEEQLKVIPETERLYVTCGENEYLGYKHHFLQGNVLLEKKVKTVRLCWINRDDAWLLIEVKE